MGWLDKFKKVINKNTQAKKEDEFLEKIQKKYDIKSKQLTVFGIFSLAVTFPISFPVCVVATKNQTRTSWIDLLTRLRNIARKKRQKN